MDQQITNYLKAGYPAIYLVTQEIERMKKIIKQVCIKNKFRMHYWSAATNLTDVTNGNNVKIDNPFDALEKFKALQKKSVCVYQDFHMVLKEADVGLIDLIRINILHAKKNGSMMIFMGTELELPAEIEKELSVVEFDLPDKTSLGHTLDALSENVAETKRPNLKLRAELIDAGAGLTSVEFENAAALSLVEGKGRFKPEIVSREKAETIKKSGILEILHPEETAADIGGLEILKHWLKQRKEGFSIEAREYGLPNPRGMLIIGIPGTGKSLTAKATANILQRPIVKLDVGRVFAGLVGKSEERIRMVTKTAEAIAPCVLFIDELEKGFSGTKSSNSTDGGTSNRVFGHFITWMQDRKAPVFIVATANNVQDLPPEFLRKGGRWDEIFFCDLPDLTDRMEIWKVQLKKYNRDPNKLDYVKLATISQEFTGAEIEQAVIDTLFTVFNRDKKKQPVTKDYVKTVEEMIPLAKMMSEQIDEMRTWANSRARKASSGDSQVEVVAVQEDSTRTIDAGEEKDDPF